MDNNDDLTKEELEDLNKDIEVEQPKTRRKRVKKGTKLYIDKNEMMDELIHYNKTGEISDVLCEMFLKLAVRYTSRPNLSGYTYREDFVGAGVLRMISQIDKFDINHEAKNPFAYFTQVVHNETMQVLNKEKKQRMIKEGLREKVWDEICSEEGFESNDKSNVDEL